MANDVKPGEHPWGDLGQIICLAVFMAAWILDSFVFGFSTFLARIVPLPVRLATAALILVFSAGFIRSGHGAVAHESVQAPRLIKAGAFARLRHPLYFGSLLFYLSLVLVSLSLVSMAVLALIFIFYDFIASYEERWLERKYGLEYREYARKVPKWLPRLRAVMFD